MKRQQPALVARFLVVGVLGWLPSVAFAQGIKIVDADGCIVGRPCANGVPLPALTNKGIWQIDTDGCVVGEPCPWRRQRQKPEDNTTTTVDWAGNIRHTTRNADGTTDQVGLNPRTGSEWTHHWRPDENLQFGVNKLGRPFSAPITTPALSRGPSSGPVSAWQADVGPRILYQPSANDTWLAEWWRRPLNGPFDSQGASRNSLGAVPSDVSIEEQVLSRQAAREGALLGVVLSQMRPGSLAEAARAAARQRCLPLTDGKALNACLVEADRK